MYVYIYIYICIHIFGSLHRPHAIASAYSDATHWLPLQKGSPGAMTLRVTRLQVVMYKERAARITQVPGRHQTSSVRGEKNEFHIVSSRATSRQPRRQPGAGEGKQSRQADDGRTDRQGERGGAVCRLRP